MLSNENMGKMFIFSLLSIQDCTCDLHLRWKLSFFFFLFYPIEVEKDCPGG